MLSVGGLTLYPVDYRSALASSLIPPPLPHQRPLQSAFPRGEATGLLRSSPRSLRGEVVPLGRPLSVEDSPSIRSITDRHSLPPSSLRRCLIGVLCSPPSLAGRQRGYIVHLLDHSGVRSCLSAGGASSATGDIATPVPGHVPFGPSLTASWAGLFLRPLSAPHLG